jgi:hypothetical protein
MEDPQNLVGRVVSSNKESKNDRSSGSCESPSDPCPSVKWKRSYGPLDENYISVEEVYEH